MYMCMCMIVHVCTCRSRDEVSARDVAPAPARDQMRDQIVSNLSRQSFARVVETLRSGASVEVRPYDDVLTEAQSAADAQQ